MNPRSSPEQILQTLQTAAAAAFGSERLEAQRAAIEATAAAISRVLREPIEPTGEEPDFVNQGR